MKKTYRFFSTILCIMLLIVGATACSSDDDDISNSAGTSIVGKWRDGSKVMTLGTDGSYRSDLNDKYGQYRVGTYSYNPSNSLMTINVKAVEGQNGAYQQTLIVQTLTSSTLVLLYADGDVEGYYTRQ
ncbi:MAG: hypothetical protein K2N28_10690 [Muribaculaceae bacterium]|nr:hypothetical protein [Muribaculaceae bacterium]